MLSNHDLDNTKIKHYRHGIKEFDSENQNMFDNIFHPEKMYEDFGEMFLNISRKMYEDPVVQKLYNERKNYDLLVVNHMFNNVSKKILSPSIK